MRTISQRELRNDSGAVLRAVEAGETVRVTVSGRPVAQLVPLQPGPRRAVDPAVLRDIAAAAPVDAAGWRADIREAVDDELDGDPWDRPVRT